MNHFSKTFSLVEMLIIVVVILIVVLPFVVRLHGVLERNKEQKIKGKCQSLCLEEHFDTPTICNSCFEVPCNHWDINIGNYQIMACNVGTTLAGTGKESYGTYFQWRDIIAKKEDSADNAHLRGGSGDTISKDGLRSHSDRQGPCSTGYHIPSVFEWYDFFCSRVQSEGQPCPKQGEVFLRTENITIDNFQHTFLFPLPGHNSSSNTTSARYRSSSTSGDMGWSFSFNSNEVVPQNQVNLIKTTNTLRCFKNTS